MLLAPASRACRSACAPGPTPGPRDGVPNDPLRGKATVPVAKRTPRSPDAPRRGLTAPATTRKLTTFVRQAARDLAPDTHLGPPPEGPPSRPSDTPCAPGERMLDWIAWPERRARLLAHDDAHAPSKEHEPFPLSNFTHFSPSFQSSFHLSFAVLVRYRSLAHI